MADHAVFVLKIGGHLVFDFDVVVLAQRGEAGDALGHPDEPLVQIEVMRRLVEQDAAAFAFPGGAPAAVVVVHCVRNQSVISQVTRTSRPSSPASIIALILRQKP